MKRITVSLPDDVAAWLARESNASAAVVESVRAKMGDRDAQRAYRRRDVQIYAAWRRHNPLPGDAELMAHSNALSLEGREW